MPIMHTRPMFEEAPRGKSRPRIVTLGRLLVVFEIYLAVAARFAFERDVVIAPPVLIFAIVDHWFQIGLITLVVCGIELAYFRTRVAAAVFVFAVVFAAAPIWIRLAFWL